MTLNPKQLKRLIRLMNSKMNMLLYEKNFWNWPNLLKILDLKKIWEKM